MNEDTRAAAAPVVIGNRQLAARARSIASEAAPGTMLRKSAGVVSICLATTKTVKGARRVLVTVGPVEVREAATELLETLVDETP